MSSSSLWPIPQHIKTAIPYLLPSLRPFSFPGMKPIGPAVREGFQEAQVHQSSGTISMVVNRFVRSSRRPTLPRITVAVVKSIALHCPHGHSMVVAVPLNVLLYALPMNSVSVNHSGGQCFKDCSIRVPVCVCESPCAGLSCVAVFL